MQKLIFILLFGFLSTNMIAQTTTSSKSDDVKVEQTVKKCSSDEAKKCSSTEAKKCSSKHAKARADKSKSCCKGEKAAKCSKEDVKETSAKKCSKGDACCTKTGKKVANCDNKKQGCCSSKQKPTR